MINFSRSVFLCFAVSVFMLAFTRDGDAAMTIMRCPFRPDCANYQGKRDILNWRSEVMEVSLVIRFDCWVYHKNSILKCYNLLFLQFLYFYRFLFWFSSAMRVSIWMSFPTDKALCHEEPSSFGMDILSWKKISKSEGLLFAIIC